MKYSLLILLSLQVFFWSSCSKTITDNPTNLPIDESLIGTWDLTSIKNKDSNSHSPYPSDLDKNIKITFINSTKVELLGYCNSGSADYVINNKEITFSAVTLTELICTSIWEPYLYELNYVVSYNIEERGLVLITNSDIDLYFSRSE